MLYKKLILYERTFFKIYLLYINMREKLDNFFYRSSTFLNAASIRQRDFQIDLKMNKDKIRTLSEIHELGPRVLFKAMEVLSQDFLTKSVLENENTFWRVWEIGMSSGHHGTSFGSKMFGHALYTGKDDAFTPESDKIIKFDNYVLKTFWLDCPPDAFRETKRHLETSWKKEYKTLIELSETVEDGPFVQIWKNTKGKAEEGKSFGIVEIKVPEEFQETFGETTRVGWIRMEKLNVFTGRTNNRVLESVKKLHSIGYTHNDLSHKNNIMVRGNDIVLIDFENAVKISDPKTEEDGKRIREDIEAAKQIDKKIFDFDSETVEVNIGSPSKIWVHSPTIGSPYTTPPRKTSTHPSSSGEFELPDSILSTPT
tara:strand:- start:203 stop:1309 length:1107 start_codon:yes stop_codon:yes gene_type:complete